MNIVIYSNCAGYIIKQMFNRHAYTKDKFNVDHIVNYENLDKQLDMHHKQILEICDIFIYQPFNKEYSFSEYDITNLKKYLKQSCIVLKVNYYRFKGFWFESEYKPYSSYNNYSFNESPYYGIHNSFIGFNGNKNDVVNKINNIMIGRDKFLVYFDNELNNLKKIDKNSDIEMYDYFINNYKTKHLFHDIFHPTNSFFYEMFRQIVFKLTNYELTLHDEDFINSLNDIEFTHWALPVLPQIKMILNITTPDKIYIFCPPNYGSKKILMDVYDYYYIRLSNANFQNYLDENNLN